MIINQTYSTTSDRVSVYADDAQFGYMEAQLFTSAGVYYQNGYTFFPYMHYPGVGNLAGIICRYEHATKLVTKSPSLQRSAFNTDLHQNPALIVTENGYILVAMEDAHQSAIYVYRSNNPYDVSGFTLLHTLGAGPSFSANNSYGYPGWGRVYTGSTWKYVLVLRKLYKKLCYYVFTSDGTTVGSEQVFFDSNSTDYGLSTQAASPDWMYHTVISDLVNNRIIVAMSRRYQESGEKDFDFPWVEQSIVTGDFTATTPVWRNWAGTWSSTGGVFSRAEYNANLRVYLNSNLLISAYIEGGAVSSTGNLYLSCGKEGGGCRLAYYQAGAWVFKDMPVSETNIRETRTLLVHSDNDIDVYNYETSGSKKIIKVYNTKDKGNSWETKKIIEHPTKSMGQSVNNTIPGLTVTFNQEVVTKDNRRIATFLQDSYYDPFKEFLFINV